MAGKAAAFMIILSVAVGFFNGRMSEITSSLLSSPSEGISVCISLCGSLCFFSGIMNICRKCGLDEKISAIMRPCIRIIIPKCRYSREAEKNVCLNISSNMLGISAAATPFGLNGAKALYSLCPSEKPDLSLASFVVLNTCSVSLLPTSVGALRASLGSENPFSILPCVLITQFVSIVAGLLSVRILYGKNR